MTSLPDSNDSGALAKVVVSACLLGQPVRYDGGARLCASAIIERWLAEGRVVAACPEVAGGLPVPRPAAEISGGAGGALVIAGAARVVDRAGNDLSPAFVGGAQELLALAQASGARVAVLKEGSPSCGSGYTYDGSFNGRRVALPGVAAALLRTAGIEVFSEEQLAQADECLRSDSRDGSGDRR